MPFQSKRNNFAAPCLVFFFDWTWNWASSACSGSIVARQFWGAPADYWLAKTEETSQSDCVDLDSLLRIGDESTILRGMASLVKFVRTDTGKSLQTLQMSKFLYPTCLKVLAKGAPAMQAMHRRSNRWFVSTFDISGRNMTIIFHLTFIFRR